MKRHMTSFPFSSRRLFNLRQLTFWRKLGSFDKSKDCPSSSTVKEPPETCSSSSSSSTCTPSTDDDPCDDPCSPCLPPEKQDSPCPCPKPPTCHPGAGNVASLNLRVFRTFVINSRLDGVRFSMRASRSLLISEVHRARGIIL